MINPLQTGGCYDSIHIHSQWNNHYQEPTLESFKSTLGYVRRRKHLTNKELKKLLKLASELLKHIEEMFLLYQMLNNVFSGFKISTTQQSVSSGSI